MNEIAREVLRVAALRGVKQIRGAYQDGDGRCALGVLMDHAEAMRSQNYLWRDYGLDTERRCLCPHGCGALGDEAGIIVHMNDYHGDDFLAIANKL